MSNDKARAGNEHGSGQQNSMLRGDVTLTNGKQGKVLRCQYTYCDLTSVTAPDDRIALPLRRRWWHLKGDVWCMSILGPKQFISTRLLSSRAKKHTRARKQLSNKTLEAPTANLEPGDVVEVRPIKDIFATLDAHGKLRGLRFTPEMAKFCGKKFKIYKRLRKIILEATGELRGIKYPTVLLEGVFCDGKSHGGCDRSCFCFWREEWLRRATPEDIAKE